MKVDNLFNKLHLFFRKRRCFFDLGVFFEDKGYVLPQSIFRKFKKVINVFRNVYVSNTSRNAQLANIFTIIAVFVPCLVISALAPPAQVGAEIKTCNMVSLDNVMPHGIPRTIPAVLNIHQGLVEDLSKFGSGIPEFFSLVSSYGAKIANQKTDHPRRDIKSGVRDDIQEKFTHIIFTWNKRFRKAGSSSFDHFET